MVFYGVESGKKVKKSEKLDEQVLLEKAKTKMLEFLTNPNKNKYGIKMDLDNIVVEKKAYTRKDGRETTLLIAKIPTINRLGNKEMRKYLFNRGYFQRYQG